MCLVNWRMKDDAVSDSGDELDVAVSEANSRGMKSIPHSGA